MKKTPSIWLACLFGSLLLTTACEPQQQNTTSKRQNNVSLGGKLTIGLANCCEKGLVATIDQYVTAVEEEVQKQGGKMLSLTANENQGAKSVIVVFVSDREVADNQIKIIEYAEKKKVAIVAGRRAVPQKLFSQFNNLYSITVSPNVLGMQQGRMVVEQWKKNPAWDKNEDKKMSFAVLRGPQEATQAKTRSDNALNAIRRDDELNNAEIVLSAHTSWKREDAKATVAKWIKSGKMDQVEVLVANSDELALGAVDALKEAKKALIPIFGINASKEGVQAILDGDMVGSILPDSPTMGALTYQVAENLARGKEPDDNLLGKYHFKDTRVINVMPVMVSKENAIKMRL